MAHCRAVLVGGLTWVLALWAQTALADAIPPPPENCPGDTVPTSDHGGQRCEPPPPEDCPPGYRGQVGGQCVVHQCGTDQDCGPGKHCLDAQICFAPHEVWVEYGRAPVSRDNLLAGPPIPLDEPKTVFDPVGVCQQAGDCESPSECRPGKLCFPIGVAATAAPPRPSGHTPGSTKDRPSGCGKGCATSGPAGAALGIAVIGVVAALLLTRRRRG